MRSRHEDKFVDALVARDLLRAPEEFTAGDIEFARRNPGVLKKLADPLEVKKRYIYAIFGVAVVMAGTAKTLEYTQALAQHHVLNDILTNIAFAVSIELFGAASVAFVMELIFEQRIKRNQDLVAALLAEASNTPPSQATNAPPTPKAADSQGR